MSRNCPICTSEVKDDGRCNNTACAAYSSKVHNDITFEEEECYECEGAGMWMVCYGGMPSERRCETCDGTGLVEKEA